MSQSNPQESSSALLFRPLSTAAVRSAVAALAWPLLAASALGADAPEAAAIVKVYPRDTGELLANPGMGWQTFHRFADEDKNLAGLPSGSAYFRFYWREVEPAEGQIDFAKFDGLLAHARRAGQKLAFRIMCTGSGQPLDVPAWLKESGCRGVEFEYGGRNCWVPDYTDDKFQTAHHRLIQQLGTRYDGHPDMDLLDIGSVGLWGEWHMSSTKDLATGKPVELPPVNVRMDIIGAWCRAFPRTSKVILIGSTEGMSGAAQGAYGWRADCLGDMGGFSKTWNHMENFYLQQLARTRAEEVWRIAPVAFESCWDMRKWKDSGWDIQSIFQYALGCHASYVNNKSAPLPEGTRADVEALLRKLGYRLTIEKVEHPAQVKAGEELPVMLTWRNAGVAPPYRDYRVALRLLGVNPESTPEAQSIGESVRGWLPGQLASTTRLKVAAACKSGEYELAVGLVEPESLQPGIKLPMAGRRADGWHTLSRVRVR